MAGILATTAVVAIFAGSIRITEKVDWDAIKTAAAGGLCLGTIVTIVYLAVRRPSVVAVICGFVAGMIFGPLAAVLVVFPGSFAVIAGGSLILILFAAVVRTMSGGK